MSDDKKRMPVIMPQRMRLREYEIQDWVANIEYGFSLEDILVPSFWAHVAAQMKPYDHIEARADDGSWVAHLLVTGCDRTWAKVAVDRVIKLTSKDIAETQASQHEVKWRGPQHKYSVIRVADREPIKAGFANAEEAAQWAREHERVVGVP